MWWDHLKKEKHLDERKVSWRQLKGCFQEKYLSEHYYDRKMKAFFELKLERVTMDEYERRFFEFLKHVGFRKGDKVKTKGFSLGYLPFIVTIVPFGLSNALAFFMFLMNGVFRE
jgi:hypothetical protein